MVDAGFDPNPLVEWCQRERRVIISQIELFESGKMWIGPRPGQNFDVNATEKALVEAKRRLAEVEVVLGQAKLSSFQTQVF